MNSPDDELHRDKTTAAPRLPACPRAGTLRVRTGRGTRAVSRAAILRHAPMFDRFSNLQRFPGRTAWAWRLGGRRRRRRPRKPVAGEKQPAWFLQVRLFGWATGEVGVWLHQILTAVAKKLATGENGANDVFGPHAYSLHKIPSTNQIGQCFQVNRWLSHLRKESMNKKRNKTFQALHWVERIHRERFQLAALVYGFLIGICKQDCVR